MAWLDTIKLRCGHNLITTNIPEKVGLEGFCKIHGNDVSTEIESYGLFDSSSPNYTHYYPEVTAEDLAPKEGDFITPTFRALSEVIVHKNWNPIDFSMNNVLKKSMGLLKGQSIYVDHETALGNAIGSVPQVAWENSYKTKNGITVPAGFNAVLKIDGKSNPRIARGIQMDPPSIHSTSVTVQFEWEKSHNISQEEFFTLLGTFDKDGKMYRRIATLVKNYHEISLVGHGADPFAQKTGENGEIINPKYAKIAYNKETKEINYPKFYSFDFKEDLVSNTEKEVTIPEETINNNQDKNSLNMKELLIALAAILAITPEEGEEVTKEQVLSSLKDLKKSDSDSKTSITDLEAKITELEAVQTEYEGKKELINKQEELKGFMDEYITGLRAEVTRLYGIIANGTPNEAITKMISTLNRDGLEALKITYAQQVEKEYPATCSDCGSNNVSRASASQEDPEKKTTNPKNVTVKNAYDAAEIIRGIKRGHVTSRVHPADEK